ncbi:MAG: hypothetical protein IJ240_06485, partial [Clostridia bacterium]|nr:hypothetical protein [Clostridia bacterium]
RADHLHFRYELNDVAAIDGPDLRTDDFLGFADYFFDGFLADVMMQSRINQARANVEQAIGQVEGVMARLRAQR